MRLLVLFLVYSIGLSYAADSYAQKAMISIDVRNQRVEDILKEIEAQSDFDFFFNNKHVDLNRRVSVSADKSNIFSVLKEVFAGTNVKYSVLDKKIILSIENLSPNQNKKQLVKGKIVDVKGEPVIGASVVEKDVLENGTVSDLDGNFQLMVKSVVAELEISFIGYQSRIVKVAMGKSLTVVLRENTELLDEVVVIGYGTQTKKTLTGSVSEIGMSNIESGTYTSVANALVGKAAGLRAFKQSAQPGGAVNLKIRGEGSMMAGNDPLIVIDGFPVQSDSYLSSGNNKYEAGAMDNILDALNPEDVESITVLKDAASTAIYGARAGHGVILITTKRGKAQKLQINYSGDISFQTIQNNYEMLDARSFMEMRNRQLYEEYLKTYGLDIYAPYISNPISELPVFAPKYSNDEILRANDTDWMDLVTRKGFMQQHNLSMNGGNESIRYLLSANYMQQEGIVRNNGASRFSFRFNLDQDVNKYLSYGVNVTFAQNKYDNVPLGAGTQENSGVLTAAIQANPANPVYDETGGFYIDPERPFVPNAVSLLEIQDKTKKNRMLGSAFVKIKPLEGLELKAQVGADIRFQKRSSYIPKTTLEGQTQQGFASIVQQDASNYLLDLTATYNKEFGSHKLTGLLGYSYQKNTGEGVNAGNKNFLIDGFSYNNLKAGGFEKPIVGSSAWSSAIASFFARVHYNYKDRYMVEGTLRTDGESNFAPENRWGFFPSISAAWRINEEAFMEFTHDWLSNLKLRASFGQTGNSNVGYHIKDFYGTADRNVVLGETAKEHIGVYATKLANPDITWETTTELNIGLDLGFFNERIRLTAEYFNRRISDLLDSRPLLSYHEINSVMANIGETKSSGVEITLNTSNIQARNFNWNTTLTLAHYEDRWSKRSPWWKPAPYEKADDPLRAQYYYHAIGIMQAGDKAPAAQADLLPGMIILQDDGNGVIGEEDLHYIGNGAPKLTFGFNNAFRYKNWDMSIYFYGETGRKRAESYKEKWIRTGGENISVMAYESFNHKNTSSTFPTYLFGGQNFGDYFVKSVYYIRCGSINLGYNVPVKNVKWLQRCRLYADVTNPFVITNWTGVDPETDNGEFAYPNIISYNFGVNITF